MTVIELSGTTSLLTDGTHYFFQPNGGAAVELSYGGSPIVAGEFGAWTPIAAQQTATGYEVALEEVGADLYGRVGHRQQRQLRLGSPEQRIGDERGAEVVETSFNFDLNGDGVIGPPPPTVIESNGSMSLFDGWDQLFSRAERGTAVTLSYNGAPVTVGQFGGWTPIAAARWRPAMRSR